MAIPGSKPRIEATAKIRIGVKKKTATGKEYPSAVDYFVGDGIDGEPKQLDVQFVHEELEDVFATGLEWWIKSKAGRNTLACYTKDGGDEPTAYRLDGMLDEGQEAIGPPMGHGRLPIRCPSRACPHLKDKKCKPMGRLVFTIPSVGDQIYQLDTKSWNSVEKLAGALLYARRSGPLNNGRWFVLGVEMVTKGSDRFPVLSLRPALVDTRGQLIAALRAAGRDPASPAVVEWVQGLGVEAALSRLKGVS
jgi:hypothetical protein